MEPPNNVDDLHRRNKISNGYRLVSYNLLTWRRAISDVKEGQPELKDNVPAVGPLGRLSLALLKSRAQTPIKICMVPGGRLVLLFVGGIECTVVPRYGIF